jgi:wzt
MKSDCMVKLNNVNKIFKLYKNSKDRFKEALSVNKKKYHEEFYALKDINLEIKKGEVIGFLGKNGAGKSTLLKIITGVLTPTSGSVEVNGKISALLELGAGFNLEYTGLENIYLNGTLMGIEKNEMKERIDDIVEFADIGDFINQPVKNYSSGMFARLAFSVAINVNPEILIVDEALSVGDMGFQEKSITKMKEIIKQGTTVIFVSHSLSSVRNFCEKAIWMEKGQIKMIGDSTDICELYQEELHMEAVKEIEKTKFIRNDIKKSLIDKKEKKTIYVEDAYLDKKIYKTDEDITLTIKLNYTNETLDYGVGILIYNEEGKLVTLFNTVRDDIYFEKKEKKIELVIPKNDFIKGKYSVTISICDKKVMFDYDKLEYFLTFDIIVPKNSLGLPIGEGEFRAKHIWKY